MRLEADSGGLERAASEIAEVGIAVHLAAAETEHLLGDLAGSTGHADLADGLRDLREAMAQQHLMVTRSLAAHGEQVRLAAQAYDATDRGLAERAADLP